MRRMFRRTYPPQPTIHPTTTADEDEWVWSQLGRPLPAHPLLAVGSINAYVALWYAAGGRPVMGRAWSEAGRLRCCFGWDGRRLTTPEELGGVWVQILTGRGDFASRRFEYRWVRWRERNDEGHVLVRVWTATPVVTRCHSGRNLLGHLDLETQKGILCAPDGAVEDFVGRVNAWVLVRNHIRPPVFPGRTLRDPQPDQWRHLTAESLMEGDAATDGLVLGLEEQRGWLGFGGPPVKHYVALWHVNGQPVFGSCWVEEGRMRATFAADGRAFTGELGTFQAPTFSSAEELVFELGWRPMGEVASRAKDWRPLCVEDAVPCLVSPGWFPFRRTGLGCCWLSQCRASFADGQQELSVQGDAVEHFLVLCRRDLPPRPDYPIDLTRPHR